jgi:UDP-N-acetylglucosamine:LPS N-acetylglucosamine transferase
LGFESTSQYLPRAKTLYVGTPVRESFQSLQKLELAIPEGVPLIVVVGGSQGAIAVNKLVRQAAPVGSMPALGLSISLAKMTQMPPHSNIRNIYRCRFTITWQPFSNEQI